MLLGLLRRNNKFQAQKESIRYVKTNTIKTSATKNNIGHCIGERPGYTLIGQAVGQGLKSNRQNERPLSNVSFVARSHCSVYGPACNQIQHTGNRAREPMGMRESIAWGIFGHFLLIM
jgi:hypothetical protein